MNSGPHEDEVYMNVNLRKLKKSTGDQTTLMLRLNDADIIHEFSRFKRKNLQWRV